MRRAVSGSEPAIGGPAMIDEAARDRVPTRPGMVPLDFRQETSAPHPRRFPALRGWLKTRLGEPDPFPHDGQAGVLWAGLALMVYGFLPIFDGRALSISCCGYYSFWRGLWVSRSASSSSSRCALALNRGIRRHRADHDRFAADLPEEHRAAMLTRRPSAVAMLPERQRLKHLQLISRTCSTSAATGPSNASRAPGRRFWKTCPGGWPRPGPHPSPAGRNDSRPRLDFAPRAKF